MSGRAKFVFWWDHAGEHDEPVPFFNVIENDRGLNNKSTVNGSQLMRDYGIALPPFPSFPVWQRETSSKRKCFRCWMSIRGPKDLIRHRELVHREMVKDSKLISGGSLMKKLIAVALLFGASSAHAWEFARNPDRFPSAAFNVSNSNLDGTRAEIDQPGGAPSRIQSGLDHSVFYSIGGDVRLPLQESLTLSVYYDFLSQDDRFIRENNVYKQTDSSNGYRCGFSLRVYFNK